MNLKVGRPPSDNPRQMRVELKLTADELEKLDYCCEHSSKTRSDVIREGISIVHTILNKFTK